MSTCILNGVTFTVFPSFVAGYLGSKSPNTIRRNAIFLPMYSLLLLVPVMLGMAALFVVPNLETNDLALLTMVTQELPAWVVALVGVAGALSAIVPMAVFMLCIGTLWGTKSVTRARMVVVASGLAALAGALLVPDALVRLSVLSYEGIAQLVPALVGGLLWRQDDGPGRARRPARGRGDRRARSRSPATTRSSASTPGCSGSSRT